ncbi:MAG: response regulator transcription factor, partial [Eubacteriaceae bacterium]|nr:response regulator transcription factor [Eubacteriaceae bacterium]
MNILIADDNKQITEVLAQYAKKENFTPYIAEDGEKALALFEQ